MTLSLFDKAYLAGRGLAAALLVFAVTIAAAREITLGELEALHEAPPGVVFEIVSRDPAALETALPRAREAALRLKRRFPALPVVIVSHGREQFVLLEAEAQAHADTHAVARDLAAAGVELQVCGTHAERRGYAVEDFPDYVGVTAEGPASIRDYQALGYVYVRIRE